MLRDEVAISRVENQRKQQRRSEISRLSKAALTQHGMAAQHRGIICHGRRAAQAAQ